MFGSIIFQQLYNIADSLVAVSYTHLIVLEHLLGRINLPGMWWIISERWL